MKPPAKRNGRTKQEHLRRVNRRRKIEHSCPKVDMAVFVHDDKILLTFNFEDGTRTITLSDIEAATNESGSDLEMFGAPKEQIPELGICFFGIVIGLEPI